MSLRRALEELRDPKILWAQSRWSRRAQSVSERRVLEIAGLRGPVSPIGSIRAGDVFKQFHEPTLKAELLSLPTYLKL